ncbi:hypothetical protein MKI84_06895 [Ancylobacter sp. A5.8]|uniref:hypothetical protein n=1 Tax=Ancylobacter gelatini TaxID=2919920 RepID=UPI001F4EBDD5|nr:hypothetical protein [Ancylobacter gelatini]MCJ8142640.1 hypothetical protein [Ancylobacter gelatini]
MKPIGFAVLLLAPLAASSALADVSGLTLTQGDIFADPVGTVMDVSVANAGANTVAAVQITCTFAEGGKPAGTVSTIIYNITPGGTGDGRIQLMGASAHSARCTLADVPAGTPMPSN